MTIEYDLPPLPDWFSGYSDADKHIVQTYARAAIEADRQQRGEPVADFPLGAIENGRVFADRVETYGFECEGGRLSMCADWQEFRRCFEYLAEWALRYTPQPAAPSLGRHPMDRGAPTPKTHRQPAEPAPNGYDTPYNLGWAAGWDAHKRAHPEPETPAQDCATYCRASVDDDVLCADDECDRESGIRPAQEPSDEAEDYIVDLIQEYGEHDGEHGRVSFDKWMLRDAARDLLARYGAFDGRSIWKKP